MGLNVPHDPAAPVHAAAYADQAESDKVDWDILTAAFAKNAVISGCEVTAQATPDLTVAVAAGTAIVGGSNVTIAAGNVTLTAAHGTLPRFDLITVDNTGAKAVVTGLAHANPCFPAIPVGRVVLAAVYMPPGATTVTAGQIVDKRVLTDPVRPLSIVNAGYHIQMAVGTFALIWAQALEAITTMARSGSLRSVSLNATASTTAGFVQAEVYKNNVATGLIATLNTTNPLSAFGVQGPSIDTFVAGDILQVKVTGGDGYANQANIRASFTVDFD